MDVDIALVVCLIISRAGYDASYSSLGTGNIALSSRNQVKMTMHHCLACIHAIIDASAKAANLRVLGKCFLLSRSPRICKHAFCSEEPSSKREDVCRRGIMSMCPFVTGYCPQMPWQASSLSWSLILVCRNRSPYPPVLSSVTDYLTTFFLI